LFFIITTFVLPAAWGQAEVILLNQNTSTKEEDFKAPDATSGRYTVKPRPPVKPKSTPQPAPPSGAAHGPVDIEKKTEATDIDKNLERATTLPNVAPDPTPDADRDENGNLLVRARDLVMGGSPEILDEYRTYLQPDDVRRNIIEIRLAPVLIYNDSNSPSFARSYNSFSPGLFFSNDIWFTMFFGLNTTYRASLNGAVSNNVQNSSFVDSSHEWASIGLRFRRFYGFGKGVPSLEFGIDLKEYQFRVPSDDPSRVKLKTTGGFFTLEAKIPSTARYTSLYSLGLSPWAFHSESASGAAILTGSQSNTYVIDVGLGGEYKLDRSSRIFFKIDYELQRSLFSGAASGPDPVSGATLTNVPVNNGLLMFHFGYIWAK